MKITFSRTPRPRQFVHKPIYWNPAEDERKEREERVRKEMGLASEDGEFKTSIKRGAFRKGSGGSASDRDDSTRAARRRSNVRLVLIIAVLLVIAAFLYISSSDYLLL